ncbi:hypothetical protein SAY87_028229 [Trapa incisa]|uniref:Uncharacterized protein n=1 Tax=Trapa incisa TaxID=236973 RepID=A0AAN7QRV2_9MYRT|nr:hypothetical protein SAY87_028229 [Trapa incisa]
MAMWSKVIAMLVVCLVLATAVQMGSAQSASSNPLLDQYKKCLTDCHTRCQTEDSGMCEMKCNGDCMGKDTADKLEKVRQDMAAERQNPNSIQGVSSP